MSTHEWLKDLGWQRYDGQMGEAYYWCKRFKGVEPTCKCNDKPGVQIVIKEWDYSKYQIGLPKNYEIALTAECKDSVWVQLTAYPLTKRELRQHLDAQCDKLIRAWRTCNE